MASTTMSTYILLSAAVLLSVLAAAASGASQVWSSRSTCSRAAARTWFAGPVALPVLKQWCCAELGNVVPYCRCGALRIMMDGMPGGGYDTPPCSWHTQSDLASTLVSETECNLMTIHGRPFCYALGAEGTTTDD